jgi:hypothetical protein
MKHALAILLFLAACGAQPAPQYFGAERHEMVLEGIKFVVFLRDDSAEVIRLGYLSRQERDRVPQLMVQAAEAASGCKVSGADSGLYRSPSLAGDTGEARLRLKCSKPPRGA